MAIAEDASTPAAVRSTANSATQTWTTAAFSPPADCLLVAIFTGNISFQTAPGTFTVSDSAAGAWTSGVDVQAATGRGHVTIFYSYRAAAPGAITVTADKGDTWTSDNQLTVRVLTGAASSQAGAATTSYHVDGGSAPANATQQNITTTTAGSRVYLGLAHNSTDTLTANANTTNIDNWVETGIFCNLASAKSTNATVTPGVVSIGYTGQSSTNEVALALLEILPGGSQPGTVTHVATSTPTPVGTTTTASTVAVTPTLPTGTAIGDRVYVIQAGNNTNGGTPTNWASVTVDTQVGPTGTAPGAGTGRRYLSVFYRDYDGVWTMPSFTLTSATQNTNACSAITLRRGATDTWNSPTVSTAGNTSAAVTAYSVTTGSLTTGKGMVLVGTATNDNVTASAESLSQTGATFANLTERSDTGSATGNDVSIKTYTADVTTGATATITHAATLSAASEGGSIVVSQTSTAHPLPAPRPYVLAQAVSRASLW
jgi:hypothetical protein